MYLLVTGLPTDLIAQRTLYALDSFPLVAVPVFLFVGSLMNGPASPSTRSPSSGIPTPSHSKEVPEEFVNLFRKYYGPTMNAFEAAEKADKALDLLNELEALFRKQNTSELISSMLLPSLRYKSTPRNPWAANLLKTRPNPSLPLAIFSSF